MGILAQRAARKAARPHARPLHVPAPLGLNTVSPASMLPATDAVQLTNLTASENGLRARMGYREWVTGLTGSADSTVRGVLPFSGSTSAKNRAFATTDTGIWSVGSSTDAPSQSLTFVSSAGNAGYGIAAAHVSAGGNHFLLYADEVNGYHVYSEDNDSWVAVTSAATSAWAATTVYALNARVLKNGLTYICTTGGTSGSTGPTGTGTGITDGTAVWSYAPAVSGIDPANVVFVTVFKGRVWLVERDTQSAYYLPIGGIYGTATKFTLGSRFRQGGYLVGLWSWTGDGGAGIDDHLVAISSGGDVVIYAGTDPSSAATWGIVGVWSVGGVPSGRWIASEDGGELLILTTSGVIPIGRLTRGAAEDQSQYATAKIASLFSERMLTRRSYRRWAIRQHPQDGTIMVMVPEADGTACGQFAMSRASRGWSQYDLPIYTGDVWDGKFYFGTTDGRVCVTDVYVDGQTYADANVYSSVAWSMLTGFSDLGVAANKLVHSIKLRILSQSSAPNVNVGVRFDFDLSALGAPSAATAGANTWDAGLWDTATWGGDYLASTIQRGATGFGTHMAIAARGTAVDRTVLVGFDVSYTVGGW